MVLKGLWGSNGSGLMWTYGIRDERQKCLEVILRFSTEIGQDYYFLRLMLPLLGYFVNTLLPEISFLMLNQS